MDKRTPLDFEYIKSQATGNWVGRIFPAVGIKLHGNGKKHQPCPLCGGSDRFRCDDKNGTGSWICNQCGAGNGYTLVKKITNKDAYDTHATIAGILGIDGGKTISEDDRKAWRQAQIQRESEQKKPSTHRGEEWLTMPTLATYPPIQSWANHTHTWTKKALLTLFQQVVQESR